VILDCDPGIDDAMAIVFACGHPGLELCAVTTVAGNIGLPQTTTNALSVLEFAGYPHVPVAAGSPVPLLRPAVHARHVHGDSGLGLARLPPAKIRALDVAATDLIIDTIGSSPGEVTLVATGPLTNIALAVRRQPAFVRQVADFVIMGGSATRGNVTPVAEFNIATDPEAAAIAFGAGWRVTMIGLHVTLQVEAGFGVRKRMDGLGRLGSRLLEPGLRGYRGAKTTPAELVPGPPPQPGPPVGGPPVHDLCALAQVAAPGLFSYRPARVEVETVGRSTAGMTVTDFCASPEDCNTLVATSVDKARFWDTVFDAWARVPAAQSAG